MRVMGSGMKVVGSGMREAGLGMRGVGSGISKKDGVWGFSFLIKGEIPRARALPLLR